MDRERRTAERPRHHHQAPRHRHAAEVGDPVHPLGDTVFDVQRDEVTAGQRGIDASVGGGWPARLARAVEGADPDPIAGGRATAKTSTERGRPSISMMHGCHCSLADEGRVVDAVAHRRDGLAPPDRRAGGLR
jgi:hypothetical protein